MFSAVLIGTVVTPIQRVFIKVCCGLVWIVLNRSVSVLEDCPLQRYLAWQTAQGYSIEINVYYRRKPH